jgi:hypothetical protein
MTDKQYHDLIEILERAWQRAERLPTISRERDAQLDDLRRALNILFEIWQVKETA